MATYKVSYKMLAKQGEELKAAAKLIDGYAERVNQIRGKLGEDQTLAEVRGNLQKLNAQLAESRTILSTAGGLLTGTVEKYTSVETRQVKKVDSLKAHNRDFYKNPVVVASAGGAAAGAAAAAAAPTTTVNYSETNTVNYSQTTVAAAEPAVSTPVASVDTAPAAVNTAASAASAATGAGAVGVAGIAAGAGVVGGALGAGSVLGVKHLIDESKKDKEQEKAAAKNIHDNYDPEAELAAAMERVRKLDEE